MSRNTTKTDNWVSKQPVATFLLIVVLGAIVFWLIYSFKEDIAETLSLTKDPSPFEFIDSMLTTVVALAGSLVTVMLAQLALRLGNESRKAAESANEIQGQIQRFSDPRYVEARNGHNAAASLDLIGTLLRQYAAQLSGQNSAALSVDAVRHSFKQANELISNANFYLFYAQLVGTSAASEQFAGIQSHVFAANQKLAHKPADLRAAARGAEEVAIRIARLSRLFETRKKEIVASNRHHLNDVAQFLSWKSESNKIAACEQAAKKDFCDMLKGSKINRILGPDTDLNDLLSSNEKKKFIVHLLESDLDQFIEWLGKQGRKIVPGRQANDPWNHEAQDTLIFKYDSLDEYASHCEQGERPTGTKLIVANWLSIFKDDPETLAKRRFVHDDQTLQSFKFSRNLESNLIWKRAIFLEQNPEYDTLLKTVLDNDRKLETLQQHLVDAPLSEEQNQTAQQARHHMRRIIVHTEQLQALAGRDKTIPVAPWNPYSGLNTDEDEIIMLMPYFAPIHLTETSMSDIHEGRSHWFNNLTYDWDQSAWNKQ